MRPRFFRIDEIGSQRRDAAPVVDSCVQQLVVVRGGKVGRRLQVDIRHQQAGHRDGAQHFSLCRFGPVSHGNVGLSTKILDDNFLDVAVTAVQLADCE